MNYQTLSQKPSHFTRYTRFILAEFNKLAKELEPLWKETDQDLGS